MIKQMQIYVNCVTNEGVVVGVSLTFVSAAVVVVLAAGIL
jgi:hypothetical protein